jgi:hypothetical protein
MTALLLEFFATFAAFVLSLRCIACLGVALFVVGLTLWLVEDSALRSLICFLVLITGLASGIVWERRRRRYS